MLREALRENITALFRHAMVTAGLEYYLFKVDSNIQYINQIF